MDPNKFEKQILDKLNQHQPKVAYDQLWDKLESRLAKRKKRRILIWLFFGFGLLLSYITYRYSAVVSYVVLHTPSNIAKTHPNPQNSALPIQEKNEIADQINSDSPSKSNLKQNTVTPKVSFSVKLDNLSKGGRHFDNLVVVNEKTILNPSAENENAKNVLDKIPPKNEVEIGFGKPGEGDVVNQSTNQVEISEVVLPTSFLSSLSNGTIKSMETNVNAISIETTKPKIGIEKNKNWSLFLSGKVNYSYLSIANNGPESIYLQNALFSHLGYGIETNVSYLLSKKVSIVAGINWSVMVDKFVYNNSISIEKMYYNPEAFILEGNFMGADQVFSKTTVYDVLHYNVHDIGSLHTGISFSLWQRWHSEFLLNYIAVQSYSGRLLDKDLIVVKDGPIFKQTLLSKLYPSIRLGCDVNFFPKHQLIIFLGYSHFRYANNTLSPLQAATRSNFEIGISSEILNK